MFRYKNDVFVSPEASQAQSSDPKVHVTWAKFEKTDINDAVFFSEHMEINGKLTDCYKITFLTQLKL